MDAIVHSDIARVVVTGSESTGKTTLAAHLAAHYGVEVVPEFSREYASALARSLTYDDVTPIATGQIAREDAIRARATSLLVQDTDLLSTVVYAHHYYDRCPAWIEAAVVRRMPRLYLLLDIDVPWVADGVRDSGDRREEVHARFIATLVRFEAPYVRINGAWPARTTQAIAAIDRAWRNTPSVDAARREP